MGLAYCSLFDPQGKELEIENDTILLEETQTYSLKVRDFVNTKVWLNALPLPQQEYGEYCIKIGHWVGKSNLCIDVDGKLHNIPIVVQPRADKLSKDRWFSMLREIEDWLPGATLGGEGGLHGNVDNVGISSPLLADALIPLLPMLKQALKVLINQPRQLDKSIWIEQNLTTIRGCDHETMTWIIQHPDIGAWLDPWKAVELEGNGPPIPIRRTIDSNDHPANQYVAWLIFRITKKLEDTQKIFKKIANSRGGSDETSIWCQARSSRIDLWLSRVLRIIKNSFLSRIERRPASESALLTIFDDPIYARVHAIGRLFLSPLFTLDISEDSFGAAVKPSYSIYEIWCYLALFNILKKYLCDWQWTNSGLDKILSIIGTGSGAFISAKHPSGGQVLNLSFNPRFVSYNARTNQPCWSISNERRPDFVISLKEKETEGAWLFFDAKYRIGRTNLGNAFESVHIYRDALHYDGYGDKCKAGCLLSPSMTTDSEEWFSKDFREKYSTGIWELKPGKGYPSEIAEWIMSKLKN